jgi:hypothetical protein
VNIIDPNDALLLTNETLVTEGQRLKQIIGEHIVAATTSAIAVTFNGVDWEFTVRSDEAGRVSLEGNFIEDTTPITPEEANDFPYSVGVFATNFLISGNISAITKNAFRNRFTFQERTAIELAAASDPSASGDQKIISATIRCFLSDMLNADFIDLSHPSVINGTHALEQMGLLPVGRADEIVSSPIRIAERYHA